jgi:hypothetical protein
MLSCHANDAFTIYVTKVSSLTVKVQPSTPNRRGAAADCQGVVVHRLDAIGARQGAAADRKGVVVHRPGAIGAHQGVAINRQGAAADC